MPDLPPEIPADDRARADEETPPRLRLRRAVLRWGALIGLSAAFTVALELAGLPAALLLGPMLAGIICSVRGAGVSLPPSTFILAQGVIGCMVGTRVPPSILHDLAAHWAAFLAGVISVIAASGLLGWLLARAQVLPGTTAVWGSAPGAASTMVLLSHEHGADMRLVAVMQFLRVGMVAISAALMARFWAVSPPADAAGTDWLPALDPTGLLVTLAVIGGGVAIRWATRMPSAIFLGPMAIVAVLQGWDLPLPALPPWLLALSYLMVGWATGLRFTRPILRHAARALPTLTLAILALLAICAGFGALLSWATGVNLLTGFLATSPGGADSVAIIAAASPDVDVPFVMAMQTARFVAVVISGPALARFVAARVEASLAARG